MRKPFLAGNWKMNKTVEEGQHFIKKVSSQLTEINNVDLAIFPNFISLISLVKAAKGGIIKIGAQNIHFAQSGAYTGEISSKMLQDIGINYVIVGHSERRQYFAETNETVNGRLKAAINNNLVGIICIGESLKERKNGQRNDILKQQLSQGLKGLTQSDMANVVIAYEPIWAIGTGISASPEDAQDAHKFIRQELTNLFGQQRAQSIIIQYGGSVKASNIAELLACRDIDGALIGGASIQENDFIALVKNASASL